MKKNLLYFTLPVIVLGMCILLAGFTFTRDAAAAEIPSWWAGSAADFNEMADNAKKEAKIIWYDSLRDKDAREMAKAFNKLFPGIEIDHTRVRGMEARETMLRELQAGVTKIDVIEVSDELIPVYEKMKLFKKYPYETKFKINPFQVSKESDKLTIGGSLYGFVVNTDRVSPQDIPRTWEDLLKPRWKGKKIGMDTRPKAFAAMWPAWGEDKMRDFLGKIAKQDILFKKGTTAGVQMTAAGEVHVYVASSFDSFSRVKAKGAPIEYIIPSPKTGVSFERLGIVANSPNPNAGILFLGWFATGGAKLYDELSGGEGIPLPGFDTAASKLIKSNDQLSVFSDEWLPKKSEIRAKCNEFLGFIEKKKKK